MSHKFVSNGAVNGTEAIRLWCEKCGYMLYNPMREPHYEVAPAACEADSIGTSFSGTPPWDVPIGDCDHKYRRDAAGWVCEYCHRTRPEVATAPPGVGTSKLPPMRSHDCNHQYYNTTGGMACILCGALKPGVATAETG